MLHACIQKFDATRNFWACPWDRGMLENNEGNKKSVAKTFVNAQGGVDRAARCTCVPSPQPSLGPLTGVRVRRNSSSVADGSTPAASYRSPFTATTTAFPIWSPPPQPRSATTASCPCSCTATARYLHTGCASTDDAEHALLCSALAAPGGGVSL